MLSEHERRELARIEQGLANEDRKLADSFRQRRLRPSSRLTDRRWLSRSLLGFAVLLLVVGLLTGTDDLFMQGLLAGGAAVLWIRAQRRAARAGGDRPQEARRRSRPNGGPTQGWSRPT